MAEASYSLIPIRYDFCGFFWVQNPNNVVGYTPGTYLEGVGFMKPIVCCPECRSSDVFFSEKHEHYICEDCRSDFQPEKSPVMRRIFLSYGHDEHASLAARLKSDLEDRGHLVWFDPERLKPGMDWQIHIEKGLDWVAEDPRWGCIVLLMTPHSVRRPDGYCLNEITRAMDRGLGVVPIMVVWCEPPLSISRIQWLDMRDCMPLDGNMDVYEGKFQRLVEALEENRLDFEGTQARLFRLLQPLPFDADISQHLSRFTGRQWLLNKIDKWLATPNAQGIFWITGKPGVGKTAVASWLCQNRREVAAFHLCRHGHKQKADPRRCVLSIAYQLSTQLPDYADRLSALNLEEGIAESDAKTLFDNLIIQPLSGNLPRPDRTIVVLVDALDEATQDGKNDLAHLIASECRKLPAWLRLIITSRPDPEVTHPFQGLDPYELDSESPSNREDLVSYLTRELEPYTKQRKVPERTIEQITSYSEGIFLYAEWIRNELETGRLSLSCLNDFPRGLGGVYAYFFQRQFPDIEAYEKYTRAALEIVAAMKEPLALEMIGDVLAWSEHDLARFKRSIGSLFMLSQDVIQPFHQSVMDWLTNDQTAGPYFLSEREGHRLLAEYGWRQYLSGADHLTPYMVAHLPEHLCASGQWDDVEKLLTDLRFVQVKCSSGLTVELAADYEMALDAWPGYARENPFNRTKLEPVPDWMKLSVEAAKSGGPFPAFQQGSGAVLSKLRHLPHKEREGGPRKPIYGPRERINIGLIGRPGSERSNSRAETMPEQSRGDQAVRTTLRGSPDSVHAFGTFVFTHLHWLASTPTLTVPTARNSCCSGPLVSRAEEIIPSLGFAWFARDPRPPAVAENPICMRVLQEHRGSVTSIAVSRDMKKCVSGSRDKTLGVWNLMTGQCLRRLQGHKHNLTCVALSWDGTLAASGSHDGAVRIWMTETGECLRTLTGHMDGLRGLALTADGRITISSGKDNTVRVWDTGSGTCMRVLEGHTNSVRSVTITPDGLLAATASFDKTIRLWDLSSGKCMRVLRGHRGIIFDVALSVDGSLALSGGEDKKLLVWETVSGECLRSLSGHESTIFGVALSGDAKKAISCGRDKIIRVWDIAEGTCIKKLKGHTNVVTAVAIDQNATLAVSAGQDRTIRVWNLKSEDQPHMLEGHASLIRSVAFICKEEKAISAGRDGVLRCWDSRKSLQLDRLFTHAGGVRDFGLFPRKQMVVSVGRDGYIRIWDLHNRSCLKQIKEHRGLIRSVALSLDGTVALSGGKDQTIRVWDCKSMQCVQVVQGLQSIFDLDLTPDVRIAVSGGSDSMVCAYELATGDQIWGSQAHSSGVFAVTTSPQGRSLISSSYDKSIRLWDIASGQTRRVFHGHYGGVRCVSVTHDGGFVLSGGWDQTVRLWDMSTGECLAVYYAGAAVLCLSSVRPDGHVVCGTEDGQLHFLSIRDFDFDRRPPIVTAAYVFEFDLTSIRTRGRGGVATPSFSEIESMPGAYTDIPVADCPWCENRFQISSRILDTIRRLNGDAGLEEMGSPCLELPEEAWDEPKLLSECPSCRKPLKFNPLIVDNRDRY